MNADDLKVMIASIGDDLAEVVMNRFIGRIRDELSVTVANAQRAQGVAERAELAAQTALNAANVEIAAAKVELEKLVNEKSEVASSLAAVRAEFAKLEPKISALRAAEQHYASQQAALIGGPHGS